MAEPRLLVLMYHGLHAAADDPGRYDPRYSVAPTDFAWQMQRIAERGGAWLPTATGPMQLPVENERRPAVLVSFDDGDVSNALQALPVLRGLGLGAVFFVTSDFVGRGGMLTPAQLRELADGGMTIGSHGQTHRFLSSLEPLALQEELQHSRDRLQQITGRAVDLLALPGGRGGQRELDCAHALGYRAVFASQPGDNRDWQPGRYLQRVAITRGLDRDAFEQILDWDGGAVRRMCWRHAVLRMPKRMLGDERYDRLRQALVG